MISPGFIDTHMHIDLSYTFTYTQDVPSLIGGAMKFHTFFDKCYMMTDDEIINSITNSCQKTIENCLINGTTALKTNVTVFDCWKKHSLDVALALKEYYKNKIDVINIIDFNPPEPTEYFLENVLPYQMDLIEEGKVDFIGGYPHKHPDGKSVIDSIFDIALKYNLPIDIHCDESDVPNLTCFEYALDKTIQTNMQGKVSFGHVTALSSNLMDEDKAKSLIEKAKEADRNTYFMQYVPYGCK